MLDDYIVVLLPTLLLFLIMAAVRIAMHRNLCTSVCIRSSWLLSNCHIVAVGYTKFVSSAIPAFLLTSPGIQRVYSMITYNSVFYSFFYIFISYSKVAICTHRNAYMLD